MALGACALATVLLAGALAPREARAAFIDANGGDAVELDTARSTGGFTVKVMWLVGVSGRFGKVQGTVHVDPFRNQVSVDARVDVNAVNMGNHTYENWVKSAEFFDAEHFPQIEFNSEPFPQTRLARGGELHGWLTLRGVRQPVSFDLQPAACERPAYDCPIEVKGFIRRSEFDMRSRRGTLSDKVELSFSVFAVPASAPK